MDTEKKKQNGVSPAARESDLDDSIIGSDELAGLRFSSQDNLLDSSQDGDNQCDVKWDYTSPQTMRQLRKMKGKYSAEDVKEIIAKFPDLPVKSNESSFKNIRVMLPPKDAAAALEKSRQARARQRELKLMRQRQRRRKVAQDMILFLQEEQHKHEKAAAEKLKTSAELEKKDEDDIWSDDDFFCDNSFLIEATQYPEKFMNANKNGCSGAQKNGDKALSSRDSKTDQCCELSASSKNIMPATTTSGSLSSHVAPSSAAGGSCYSLGRNPKVRTVSVSKAYNYTGRGAAGLSSGSFQNKRSTNTKTSSYTRGSHQRHESHCDNKTSTNITSLYSSSKNPAACVKSPFRKSLSFDTMNNSKYTVNQNKIAPRASSKPYHNSYTAASKSRAKGPVSHHQSKWTISLSDQNLSGEQDLFDSSLSDELLLQATLSQELAMKCGSSQPLSSTDRGEKEKTQTHSAFPCHALSTRVSTASSKAMTRTSSIVSKGHKGDITNSLLSPVRPERTDFEANPKIHAKSPQLPFSRKGIREEKSSIPAHLAKKHKSPQGLSSSTPVKCFRAQEQECSDSFLEKAFEDSFMNDEALFESQILPMLELAESQVQKAKNQEKVTSTGFNAVHSPVKCSPEEIEFKRQTAIRKRSQRLAQMSHRKS